MFSLISLAQHIRTLNNPPALPVQASPLRFGILGAANIAPNALILPARNHPEMVVYALAARDAKKAEAYAQKHKIEKVYSGAHGYQDLLDDPMVDAVYNPLPNGLHFEWTMKALAAGKHVLLEKPSADTADETRQMFELAERKGLVLLEAFHYRFYPAIARVKDILDSGELGPIKTMYGSFALPQGFVGADDINFQYALGGGALIGCGCYPLNALRYLASANPTAVLSATARTAPSASDTGHLVDHATTATLSFPNDVTGTIHCDLAIPGWGPFGLIPSMLDMTVKVDCEGGSVELFNFAMSAYYHSITVLVKDDNGRLRKRVEKAYTFHDGRSEEEWWSTYRHQLEAFVDKVKGRTPKTWVGKEDSVDTMIWIEKVYEKTGLGSRPKSKYVPPE
ncbi:NAD(P)-binding protein, partial [Athelia psychrophila]